VQDLEILASCR